MIKNLLPLFGFPCKLLLSKSSKVFILAKDSAEVTSKIKSRPTDRMNSIYRKWPSTPPMTSAKMNL